MRSRRSVLAGLGTVGVAGLAGCSALPFGDDEDDGNEDVSLPADAIERIAWPESPFPVAVPPALADAHDERASELLAAVPADPSVPNGAVAEELRSDRERAADRLADDVDEPWPTEALSRWRSRRNAAASVRGAYRAATGGDDASTVAERRRAIREDLGSFVADHEYRAASPVEAVLLHAPIEELVTYCRQRVRPSSSYPADPVASPFRAGDAVGSVEVARAALDDARGLREAYLAERSDPTAKWAELTEATDRLRRAVFHTLTTVDGVLESDDPPFEADLDGTAGRWLFDEARLHVESSAEEFRGRRADEDCATEILDAGRALADIEAFRTAIDGIRDDGYQDEVTVESVTRTAERARDALAEVEESDDRRLATQIARPAFESFEYVSSRLAEGYADAARVQGDLARVELYARAVPSATTFVLGRLG